MHQRGADLRLPKEPGMGRIGRALALFGLSLSLLSRPVSAQQFSADLVKTDPVAETSRIEAKLYVADRKVRIETPALPNSFLLVDSAAPFAYLVRPAQRMFIDARQSSRLTRLFVPLDPADPCPQWQAIAAVAVITDSDEHCDAQGHESVEGRDAIRFSITSARGRSTGWIDAQLKFPVKIETEDGAVLALRNIEAAPQPVEKFDIPADFKKIDPGRIIEQLKRTDIWVEPPH
jgi:hypothetical protein